MVDYVCMNCGKTVGMQHAQGRVRCPYCGYKILYKQRVQVTHVKAR
ncbi:MAG: DNA-directed RNA polymerase subunit P [Candidatus Woesearchaeota archaeon]